MALCEINSPKLGAVLARSVMSASANALPATFCISWRSGVLLILSRAAIMVRAFWSRLNSVMELSCGHVIPDFSTQCGSSSDSRLLSRYPTTAFARKLAWVAVLLSCACHRIAARLSLNACPARFSLDSCIAYLRTWKPFVYAKIWHARHKRILGDDHTQQYSGRVMRSAGAC